MFALEADELDVDAPLPPALLNILAPPTRAAAAAIVLAPPPPPPFGNATPATPLTSMPVVCPIASTAEPKSSPPIHDFVKAPPFFKTFAAFKTVPKLTLPPDMSSNTPIPPASTPPTPNRLAAPPPDIEIGLGVLS